MIQDKKLISYAKVKFISNYDLKMSTGETFEQRINDFIKDKNIYDIQYIAGDTFDSVMVVYQVVKRV